MFLKLEKLLFQVFTFKHIFNLPSNTHSLLLTLSQKNVYRLTVEIKKDCYMKETLHLFNVLHVCRLC